MNILFLANHLNIGGISNYVFTLATGLKKKGHHVYLASSGGDLLAEFTSRGIIHLPIPIRTKAEISPRIMLSKFRLKKIIRDYKIDILHSQSRTTQVLGCLLEHSTAAVHVSTCHGFFKLRFLRRIFPCWGRRVIAISQQVKEHLIVDFQVEAARIRVIPNGINPEFFQAHNAQRSAQLKKELGIGPGPVVGIIARLSDVKGHSFLIQAMKTVLEECAQAQLLIVGEGKEKEKLVNLSKSLGIEKNVFFLPSLKETKEMLGLMDIFVMPSLQEGLGLALMEAMAGGLAVIGSDVGGIKSLIKDGENGLLIQPKDASALAERIRELISDSAKRSALGRRAQELIRDNFSGEKMVSQTEEVYSECLNAKD